MAHGLTTACKLRTLVPSQSSKVGTLSVWGVSFATWDGPANSSAHISKGRLKEIPRDRLNLLRRWNNLKTVHTAGSRGAILLTGIRFPLTSAACSIQILSPRPVRHVPNRQGPLQACIASFACFIHTILLVISIIWMISLLAGPYITKVYITKHTTAIWSFYSIASWFS